MLQTIEVKIDENGHIQPVEPLVRLPVGRALLTLLDNEAPNQPETPKTEKPFDDLFGIIKATNTASLDDMKQAIYQRAAERFNDSN
ncbi:hypothetical protein [Methyloglobulus sp.]|uniref:hypothetical protein n=1 Tax=Methyloglobulus sp. TaxID=2518622 RepID=UPI0032B84341